MPKVLLALAFATFIFASGVAASRSLPTSESHVDADLRQQLSQIPFVALQEICREQVVLKFGVWFDAWIVQFLQRNSHLSGTAVSTVLKDGVREHIEKIKAYLAKFEAKEPELPPYAPLHMDIQVTTLNQAVSRLIDRPLDNPFTHSKTQAELSASYGLYVPDLIQSVLETPLGFEGISRVGKAFEQDWKIREKPEGALMAKKVKELAGPVRETLLAIIKVFTHYRSPVYKKLTSDTKKHLQDFFDAFIYLLSPSEFQDAILTGLVGSQRPLDLKPHPFFTDSVFSYLNKKPTGYSKLILRDKFLTLLTPETDLERIHAASKELFFSWDFLSEFAENPADLMLGAPEDEKNKDKQTIGKRKKAKLDVMMYKVFLFVRVEKKIPFGQPMDNQSILKTLFEWVRDTTAFENPIDELPDIADLEDVLEESSRNEPRENSPDPQPPRVKHGQLFNPAKFNRFRVPLLHHICSKITGCKLLAPENKPKIVDACVKHGNFEELKLDPTLDGLIPVSIAQEILIQIQDNEILELENKLDDILGDTDDFNQVALPSSKKLRSRKPGVPHTITKTGMTGTLTEDDSDPEEILEQVQKPDTPAVLTAVITPKQEEAFGSIVSKFLPPNGEVTPKTKDFVARFLDKAEASGHSGKKAVMRTLLIRAIFRIYSANEKKIQVGQSNPATQLVLLVNQRLVAQIIKSFDYSQVLGLQNFLEMSMGTSIGFGFNFFSEEEAQLFHNDIIFFLFLAAQNRFNVLKQQDSKSEEYKAATKEMVRVLGVACKYLIPEKLGQLKSLPEQAQALIGPLMSSPLLMERLPAYEFMVSHIDLFARYQVTSQTPKATYGNVNNIFLGLYSFLVHLRTEMVASVGDPHNYVLQKLEGCLSFTETVDRFTPELANTLCKWSHRKYAELYYFYKTYLIDKSKPAAAPLAPYAGRTFDTHIRIFANFAHQESRHLVNTECKKTPETSLCVSWGLFNHLLTYLHDETLTRSFLVNTLQKLDWENPATKFHVLGAFESALLNTKHSNVKQYSKILQILKQVSTHDLELFEFSSSDVPALASYLKRTYRRRILTTEEQYAAKAVREILATRPHEDLSRDFFGAYLVYRNVVHLDRLKFFLLLASNDAEYTRIAEVIVKAKGGISLVQMIGDESHSSFSDFMTDKIDSEHLDFIHGLFQKQLTIKEQIEQIREFVKPKNLLTPNGSSNSLDIDPEEEEEMARQMKAQEDELIRQMTEVAEEVKTADENFKKMAEKLEVKESVPEVFVVEQLVQIEKTNVHRTKSLLMTEFELPSEPKFVGQGPHELEVANQFNEMMQKALSNAKKIGKQVKPLTEGNQPTANAQDILGEFVDKNKKDQQAKKGKLLFQPKSDSKKLVI